MPALTDTEISAILSQQVGAANDHDRDEGQEGSRAKALDYFFGRMDSYVPPETNRSKVVSRDVADTMGWIMPQLMRVYLSSDKFAEAEPVEESDIQFSEQITAALNYVFFKDNDGEGVCYDASWEALLFSDGIVKTYYDETPQFAVSFHSGLTEDQVAMLLQPNEDGVEPEVLASSQRQELVTDPMSGQQVPIAVWDCKIKRQKAKGRFVIEAIPRGHYRKNATAKSPYDALFQSHVEQKTRSELIEMGFDRDKVMSIPVGSRRTSTEDTARNGYLNEDSLDKATEQVDLHECYAVLDVDGDDMAETVRAFMGGDDGSVLLDWEVWEDENPFDVIQYEPVPHRFEGRSVADKTIDVQDVKTVLERQALNNIYATNNPQRFAKGKIANPEELTTPSFNGTIFGDASSEIVPLPVPFVANHAFEGMAYQDEVVQRRTGVGRQSMALDPEALQNQSATANQNNKDAAYSQVELAARNMAKGWRLVFRKLLKLMVKHQDTPRSIRMKGDEFVTIDPRFWNADMDVTINVGLGTGSRDRDMMMLQQVLMNQLAIADRFMQFGATEQAIEMLPKIIRTMSKIAESAGLRNPDEFYPDNLDEVVVKLKEQAAAAAQQPNPEVVKEQAKAEAAMQLKQVDAQVSMQQAEIQAQGDIVKNKAELEADLQTSEAERTSKLQLEQVKQGAENQRFFAKLQQDRELALLQMGMAERESSEKDADGKPVKKPVDATAAMMMDGLGKLGEMVAQMNAMMTAPVEIVRGPDGKAVGTRKVLN